MITTNEADDRCLDSSSIDPRDAKIINQELYEIVDRELATDFSPGTTWCDDIAEHQFRITVLDTDDLSKRRFIVHCTSCETAMLDETRHPSDSVRRHLRDSLEKQKPEILGRLARWTRFVRRVSIRASHGGPAPIRTKLDVALRWTGEIVVRVFLDVEDAMEPWKEDSGSQNRFSEVATGEPTARDVRDLVLRAWAHELDEHFRVDDDLVLDPHDSYLAINPPPRIVG